MTGSDYTQISQEKDGSQKSDPAMEISVSEENAPIRRASYADDTKSCESQTLLPRSFRAWTPELRPEHKGVYAKRSVNVRRVPTGRGCSRTGNKVKDGSILNVLAAQTLKIASMNGLGELDKLENELEDEINYENRSPAKTAFGRFRREGYHKLHSKMILFIVVFLNVIDCLIVMTELILDFHNVSQKEDAKAKMLENFLELMISKYNGSLSHLSKNSEESYVLLQHVLNATVIFNRTDVDPGSMTELASGCHSYLTKTRQTLPLPSQNWSDPQSVGVCFGEDSPGKASILQHNGQMSLSLISVGHKLHYISIAILSVLVVVLALRIICSGKRFLKSRMQVFDGVIVLISFILDIVFIEGPTGLSTNDFVMILTFLLPWRIIRVLNSLIVAVLDKQRLNLKIIYTQKKKITRTLAEVNNKVEVMQRHVEVLQNLCSSRGIGEYEVKRALGGDSTSTLKNGSSGGLASMMALGKLAFQAADAFAPMTNGYKKNDTSASEPVLTALDTTQSSPSSPRSGDRAVENNNLAPGKKVPDPKEAQPKSDSSEPYPDVSVPVSPKGTDGELETVMVHLNGSGPPKERSQNEDSDSSPINDRSDVVTHISGNEIISRL